MHCCYCKKYIRNDAWKTSHTGGLEWMHVKCANEQNYPWTVAIRRTKGKAERWTRKNEQ